MEQKKIWAFGGGKGGVGKSFVAGNLGILLAQNGHTVILADLDLGGANMHTWLGVNSPTKSISEFIEREEQDIKKLLIPTDIPSLNLLSGAKDGVEIANMKHTQKRRFITALRQLDADYIVIDLGGANMHTWLGVNSPTKSISEFIEREEKDIKKLLIPTDIKGLNLHF